MTATITPIKPDESLDRDILTSLDFDPAPPCEHSQHHRLHVPDQFASYVIRVVCPMCKMGAIYNICESGRTRLLSAMTGCQTTTHKTGCGYVAKGSDFVIACTPLENIT